MLGKVMFSPCLLTHNGIKKYGEVAVLASALHGVKRPALPRGKCNPFIHWIEDCACYRDSLHSVSSLRNDRAN